MITVRQVIYAPLDEVITAKLEEDHKFKVGEMVMWTSNRTTKQGEIIAIVPPLGFAPLFEEEEGFSFRHLGSGGVRHSESYVIALPLKPKCRMRQCYWPLVSQLKRV